MANVDSSILANKIEIDMNVKRRLEILLKKISNNLNSLYHRDNDYSQKELVNIIQNELINIANLLKSLDKFKEEYIGFLKIKTMLSYILENINSIDFKQTKSIFESIYKFNTLVKLKIRSLDENSLERNYDGELKKFSTYLKDLERFFYLDIYKSNGELDDIIIKMSKVLLE